VRRRVRLATIFSAGFAEIGPEGALQARIVAKARAGALRRLGPNCIRAVEHSRRLAADHQLPPLLRTAAAGAGSVCRKRKHVGQPADPRAARGIGFAKMGVDRDEVNLFGGRCGVDPGRGAETKVIVLFLGIDPRRAALAAAARGPLQLASRCRL